MIQFSKPTPVDELTVWTRMGKAVGSSTRYASDQIRALPTADQKGVILQATDGHQAVCVLSSGCLARDTLIPAQIMPTRQIRQGVKLARENGHWISSDGKLAPVQAKDARFPPIAEVMPSFNGSAKTHAKGQPIVMGIDVSLLRKVCDALGTGKLTFIIPEPVVSPKDGSRMVTQAVGVCPAEEGVQGIAAIMPLKPTQTIPAYEAVRKQMHDAERRLSRQREAAKPEGGKRQAAKS